MWKRALWRQLGAAIDMLDDAIRDCPEGLWSAQVWEEPSAPGVAAYWYLAYHTLFWLDLHSSGSSEGFVPPAPFGLEELDPAGVLPPRAYTPAELRAYLAQVRQRCRATIESLSDEGFERQCRIGRRTFPFGELLLYTMRHVQEHAAQLNAFLGQRSGTVSGWVGAARDA